MRVLSKEELVATIQEESIKTQYLARAGQPVSTERFIFACYDTIKNLSRIEGSFRKELEWPELEQASRDDFSIRLKRLVAWYYSNHLEFHTTKAIDVAELTHLSIQIAHLEKDFRRLCQQSMMIDDKSSRPVQVALDGLIEVIQTTLAENLSSYMGALFKWIYQKPIFVNVDFNQVPPVGRYAKLVLRSRDRKPQVSSPQIGKSSQQTSGHSPNPEKSQRADGQVQTESDLEKGKYPRDAQKRDGRKPYPKEGGRDGQRHRDKPSQGQSDSPKARWAREERGESTENLELEKAALDSVETATLSLKNDQNLQEITLAPQNSYYRRLQHQRAEDLGFASDSVGEGKERSVRISKKS